MFDFFVQEAPAAIPIYTVSIEEYPSWLDKQEHSVKTWFQSLNFLPERCRMSFIPDAKQKIRFVLVILNNREDFWALGDLANVLPEGCFRFSENSFYYALAFALGAYRFRKYREPKKIFARLDISNIPDAKLLEDLVTSIYFIRDMVNTPTEDFGPEQIAKTVLELGQQCDAKVSIISGEELIEAGFPLTYAVGRGAVHKPKMIDFRWGNSKHSTLTLIGKGVCFDTGGLDLKPSAGMRLMKKDKAGAAFALGLAKLIISQKLPINLRVLIPAVENAISGNSYRPGEILRARNGLTIEVSNTDAEGRLILADALIEAVSEKPKWILDFATLTGAARVALGPEVGAVFSNNDAVAQQFIDCGQAVQDPLWRLPLYQPYRDYLKSDVANLVNASETPFAGAITAALFLESFVPKEQVWAHFDVFAWNMCSSPGRPAGAEALGFRAIFEFIRKHCVK